MKKICCILSMLMATSIFAQYDPLQANPGFERAGATPPNWVMTAGGTLTRDGTPGNVRSGTGCASIASLPSNVDFTTLHNTNFAISVPATGTNYVTIIAWARRAGGGTNNVVVGIDAGTSLDVDGPTTPGSGNFTVSTTYTRISYTFLATNGTSYHPVLYARQGSANGVYWDDVIIYTSTQPNTDVQEPAGPRAFNVSSVSGSSVTFNFTQGPDTLANQSGIDGVLILKNTTSPLSSSNIPLLNQSFYSTNASIGVTTPFTGWSVIYNGPAISSYTDNAVAGGAVYLVYMRDRAFNYTLSGGSTLAGLNEARVLVANNLSATIVNGPNASIAMDAVFVAANNTLSLNGPAATYTIRPQSQSEVFGALSTTGNLTTQGDASRLAIKNGGVFRWVNNAGLFNCVANWETGSICYINNTSATNGPSSNLNQSFSNFIYERPLQNNNFSLPASFTVRNDFQVAATGTGQLIFGANTSIGGSFDIVGNITMPAGATLTLNGDGASQYISGPGIITPAIPNLRVNTTNGGIVILLDRDIRVSTQLQLSEGLLLTNNNVLELESATATIVAPPFGSLATSYVATITDFGMPATSGGLRWLGINNATRLFPVGNSFSSYSPANLVVTGVSEDFTVRVAPGVAPGATFDFSAGLVWDIGEATDGGNQVQVNLQWNGSDEAPDFNRLLNRILKSDGTFILEFEKGNQGAASGSDPYTKSSGTWLFTNFSPFSVSSEEILLPARFTSIRANWQGNGAQISWQNATEKPGTRYLVQRSADGQRFTNIATVQGTAVALSNKDYSFTDLTAATGQTWYYRIAAIEGTVLHTSQIVKLSMQGSSLTRRLQLAPNIILGQTLYLSSTMPAATEVQAILVDNTGRTLMRQKIQLPAGSSAQGISLQQPIPAGTYYLQIFSPAQGWKEVLKAVKQ